MAARGRGIRAQGDRLRVGAEDGLTLIEVMVAAMILALGVLAILQTFDTATRGTYHAEETQVVNNVAQRELEEIRNLDYDEVALTSAPSASSDQNDPRNRVSGTAFDLDRDGNLSEMVINGGPLYGGGQVTGGLLAPGPEAFQSGDVSGQIYRFVVWRNDPSCSILECPGTQDLKRVVVAIKLDTVPISYERPYIEVQSDFVDPDQGIGSGGPPPGGGNVTGQEFWLTDTPCAASPPTARQAITGDHPVHNTLGGCADGVQTGSTDGAPDALIRTAPPDPAPADPNNPPLYDYASDVEPTVDPGSDRGLQVRRGDSGDGCDFTPGGGQEQQTIHRWVTDPMPSPGTGFVMTGRATFELWTRSLNDAVHPGEICVYLFVRTEQVVAGEPVVTDTLVPVLDAAALPNPDGITCASDPPFARCSTPSWPHGIWGRLGALLNFNPLTVLPGQRLGLAISVEREGTPADALQFLYDHPDHKSRLEVDTTTPFPQD
jgi:type II secretory pathway pseudopilin PulG